MLTRRIVFIFLLSTIVLYGQAETNTKDSLRSVLKNATLEEKFLIYSNLESLYQFDQIDSSFLYSIKLVDVAIAINDHYKLGTAYRILGINYDEVGLYGKAIESYYLAIEHFDSTNFVDKKKLIAGCYHNLGWTYTFLGELNRAPALFHNALLNYGLNDRSDSLQFAVSYHALGSYYSLYEFNHDSSVYYLNLAINIRKKCQVDLDIVAQAELELVQTYVYANRLKSAEDLLLKIKLYNSDSLSEYSRAYITFNEGLILDGKNNFTQALNKFKLVYSGLETIGLTNGEEAINLLKQMVSTSKSSGDMAQAFNYLNLLRETEKSSIYIDRQVTTKAMEISSETARKEELIFEQGSKLSNQQTIIKLFVIFTFSSFVLIIIIGASAKKINAKNKRIELLMRELHHRVKNNLQIISSLLGLQYKGLKDASAQAAISEGKQRIRAMSLIHQKLYQNEEVTSLNINEYLTRLVDELAQSHGYTSKAKVEVNIAPISIDADTSLPIGLIVNELVSNAFKYAYKDIEEPILELNLIQEKNNLVLSIRDNGKGLPTGFSMESASTFGMKLVNLLVRQLRGSLEVVQKDGLSYNIKFQIR